MSSREYWGTGPPPRRAAPAWNQYHDRPPPHYEEQPRPPPDPYYDHPTPPPPQPAPFYKDDPWHHDERPHRPPFPPVKKSPLRGSFRGGRGRGRGEGSSGRGRGNGPKPPPRNDTGKKSNPSAGVDNSSTGKPAWMTQSRNQDKPNVTNLSSDNKPAWLSQAESAANINATKSTDSKPAWLTKTGPQSKTNSNNTNSTDSNPAWLNMSGSPSKTNSNTTNTSGNMPAWLTAPAADKNTAKNNSVTSSPTTMPTWLQSGNINKVITTSQVTSVTATGTTRTESPPPPPPPSYPPPKNQPKIYPVPTAMPSTSTQAFQNPSSGAQVTKQMNKAKNKALAEVKVAAPGEANFISFKNSLQEYSQKKGFHVPVYRTFKNGYGQSAKVEVASKTFQSSGIQKDKKEAEQNAAYEALKALGLLSATVPFTMTAKAGTKRPQPTPQAVAKKLKGEIPAFNNSPNYKSQLNEFCQKFHLPVPTYETVHDNGGFVTTLVYNKKVYLSTSPQQSKKAAELNVAQLVLSKVNQAPPPMDQNQQMILQNFVAASSVNSEPSTTATTPEPISISSVQDLTAKDITPMVSYKNKLQEVCHKKKTFLPVYDTSKDGNVFNCKVAFDGKVFNATGCKTKKGAEQSAARVALQALGLIDE